MCCTLCDKQIVTTPLMFRGTGNRADWRGGWGLGVGWGWDGDVTGWLGGDEAGEHLQGREWEKKKIKERFETESQCPKLHLQKTNQPKFVTTKFD